jgi:hypothetical protein
MIMQKITRLMHVGQLSQKVRDQLDADGGVLYLDEGIPVTAILQDFKAPGVFCGYRRMSFVGFLALSDRRIVVRASFFHEASVNVAFDEPEFRAITFRLARKRLEMAFEAKGLIPRASGEIRLRARISDPVRVVELLRVKGAVFAGQPTSESTIAHAARPSPVEPYRSQPNR